MHPQNFMIFGTYRLHTTICRKWDDVKFMSLCQLLFARGRYKHEYFLSAL